MTSYRRARDIEPRAVSLMIQTRDGRSYGIVYGPIRQQNGDIFFEKLGIEGRLSLRQALRKSAELADRYATDVCIIDEDGVWHREWAEVT
jgi:hypothetical protein